MLPEGKRVMTRRVLLGRIVGVHGVRGLVKVAAYTEVPEAIGAYGPLQDEAGRAVRLTVKGRAKEGLLAEIEGVMTREAAEALKGRDLYVLRAALPDPGDEIYQADLVGLAVRDMAGARLGQVVAVADFGAGPLLEVAPDGDEQDTVFLPFTDEVVPVVAIEAGHLTVDMPQGLWPEDVPETGEGKDDDLRS